MVRDEGKKNDRPEGVVHPTPLKLGEAPLPQVDKAPHGRCSAHGGQWSDGVTQSLGHHMRAGHERPSCGMCCRRSFGKLVPLEDTNPLVKRHSWKTSPQVPVDASPGHVLGYIACDIIYDATYNVELLSYNIWRLSK